jgi:ABC-type multidrug transport system ATPase subunit
MIEAHQLTKRYGDKTAVEDLSVTVRPICRSFPGRWRRL